MNSSSLVIILPEDRGIGLHGLLHVQPDLSGGEGTVRLPVRGSQRWRTRAYTHART